MIEVGGVFSCSVTGIGASYVVSTTINNTNAKPRTTRTSRVPDLSDSLIALVGQGNADAKFIEFANALYHDYILQPDNKKSTPRKPLHVIVFIAALMQCINQHERFAVGNRTLYMTFSGLRGDTALLYLTASQNCSRVAANAQTHALRRIKYVIQQNPALLAYLATEDPTQ